MKKLILAMATAILTLSACNTQGGGEQQAAASSDNNGGNAAIENIMTRTSIRKYKDQPVEQEKIDIMLKAAMAAPTAINRQPWHFVVVTDTAIINKLAGPRPTNAPLMIVVCGDMSKTYFPDDMPGGKAGEKRKMPDFWVQDVSAATENLLLAAHALGLGAVWTGGYPDMERSMGIAKNINAPQDIVPLCVVRVGYPDEAPEPKDKFNEANVSYNTYGGKK